MILNNIKDHATKTTFYIENGNKERMDKFVSSRKRTQFINKALDMELRRLEEEKRKQNTIKAINNIIPIKSDKSAIETIREMRGERQNILLENIKK